jgi:hypothetical protein
MWALTQMHLKQPNWNIGFTIQYSTKSKKLQSRFVWYIKNIDLEKGLINVTRAKICAINLHANNEVDFINIILIDFRLQIKILKNIIPQKHN